MGDLGSRRWRDVYGNVLQIDNLNAGIDGTLQRVQDGKGGVTPLRLSTDEVELTGTINVIGGPLLLNGEEFIGPPGPAGATGATGPTGATGAAGPGVAAGGAVGQLLGKSSGADYATEWQTQPYDLGIYIPDEPTADMICARVAAVRAFTLPASLTGSVASAGTAATASTVFTIHKGVSSIGTVTFDASATAGTFSFASSVSFASGDVLRITAPATPDATLSDISISLAGTRA